MPPQKPPQVTTTLTASLPTKSPETFSTPPAVLSPPQKPLDQRLHSPSQPPENDSSLIPSSPPPPKPPDLFISQSPPSTPPLPPLLKPPDGVLTLSPPPQQPEKVLPMFSSPSSNLQPPPEPSDLQSTPKSILPLPPTSRPPRKPPDRSLPFHVAFRSAVLRSLRNHHLRNIIFFWRFRYHSLCFPDMRVTVFDPGGKFVASIVVVCRRSQIGVIISSSHRQQPLFSFLVTNKIFYTVRLIFVLSHQWVENLICVKSIPPTVNCHASNCLSSTTSQARDVLMFLCISIFHAPAVVLLQDFKSTHSHVTPLMPTSHTIPPVWNPTRFANQFTTAAKLFVLERT
ncbi:hypothetical protein L195_g047053 [Trifolium pratense]|uniref:Uncharacterized protein n=1 Tax=Trifolium pratense TaxID=57577 RepID=A0A2K3MJF1_TRIPR|nr:hypothetical protein L195_g047053 [Trifolium pratense]